MSRPSQQEHARSFNEAYLSGWREGTTSHHKMIFRSSPFFRDSKIHRILDVGCGRGIVLKQLTLEGYDVVGTEIAPCLFAKDLRREAVSPVPVSALGTFDDNDFDLVLMVELLNHLRDENDVDAALGHANRLAREGVIVTIGGFSEMQTVDEPEDWWRGKIGNAIEFQRRSSLSDSGVTRYAFLRDDE